MRNFLPLTVSKRSTLPGLPPAKPELTTEPVVLTSAPEICVEILSPSNTQPEINEKRALYFDAGATEVWICNLNGSMSFNFRVGNLSIFASG